MMPLEQVPACRSFDGPFASTDARGRRGCCYLQVYELRGGRPHASGRFHAALAPLRERAGLAPDLDDAMPFCYLHLAAEPPVFARPGDAPAPTAHLLRPESAEPAGESPPPWVAGLPPRPTVYATLGTVFDAYPAGRATFAAILVALREEPCTLIVTVGRDVDPAEYGPQPANVRIERHILQDQLLPHCDLVVSQGGFGTVTGALGAGLPLVVIPIGADQPLNAVCCAALGVGVTVDPEDRTPDAIRAAVRTVLAHPTYRANAMRVRDEMAALPGPEQAVALLEHLAAEKQPLLTG